MSDDPLLELSRELRQYLRLIERSGLPFLVPDPSASFDSAPPSDPEPTPDSMPKAAPKKPIVPPRPAPALTSAEALASIAREIAACTACPLAASRTNTVPGEGDPNARLMFIGEGPGFNEDQQGRPFVGAAGQLLDKMIVAMGLKRDQVFILNVVKCRPPENRVPTNEEAHACAHFLDRQIAAIRPEVICLLGKTAVERILNTTNSMKSLRGAWHRFKDTPTLVTYHPAYLLRNPPDKAKAWEDLQMLMEKLGLAKAPKPA